MKKFIRKNLFGLYLVLWSVLNFGLFFTPFVGTMWSGPIMNGYQTLNNFSSPWGVISSLAIMQSIFIVINSIMLICGTGILILNSKTNCFSSRKFLLTQIIFGLVMLLLSIFIIIYVPNTKNEPILYIPESVPMVIIGFDITFFDNILISLGFIIISILSLRKLGSKRSEI